MGRLEDIVERNKNPKRFVERTTVTIGMGVFILIILGLMVFTNLGKRPEPRPAPARISPTDRRVDDIKLWTPARRTGSGSGSAQGVRP